MTKHNKEQTVNSETENQQQNLQQSADYQIQLQLMQQMAFNNQLQQSSDEIPYAELGRAVWSKKLQIVLVTLIFTIASVFYALSLPNVYKSEVLLSPVTEESGGMNGLAAKFGGLASLAGVNLGGGGIDKTGLAIEIMQSRQFIASFINENNLLVHLMAVEGWKRGSNELSFDPEIYNSTSKTWVREVEPPFKTIPSDQESYKKFKDILSITQNKETSMVTIAVEHYSPVIAKQWLDLFVKAINSEMKSRELNEAQKSIEYLEQQLNQTHLSELQNVLYQIMEEQTKTIMFANVRDEYAFKTIDPALVPEQKNSPKRALIVVLTMLLGAMLAIIFILIRYFYNKNDEKT